MYTLKPKLNKNLELFIENLEKNLINPKNVTKFRHNITREEQIALEKIRNWDEQTIRIQDKGSSFVIHLSRKFSAEKNSAEKFSVKFFDILVKYFGQIFHSKTQFFF